MQWVEGRNYLQKTSSTLTYCFDWSQWLNGLNIASYSVTAASGLTVASSRNDTTRVWVSISGVTLASPKTLTCTITTNANPYAQTDSRSITIEGVS